jgi:GTP cyclohydrolase I
VAREDKNVFDEGQNPAKAGGIDKKRIENAVREILLAIGEDPTRQALIRTPARVANMYAEIFSGISKDPKDCLEFFDEKYDESGIVSLKKINFHSMCDHHMIPFFGTASIAYIPSGDKILGISKLARIVDIFSRRLQTQERLTRNIADFIEKETKTPGVAVILEAEHLCVAMRGIKKNGCKTMTSIFRGELAEPERKLEIMSLLDV